MYRRATSEDFRDDVNISKRFQKKGLVLKFTAKISQLVLKT